MSGSRWPATARRHITLTDSLRRITGLQTETRGAICRSHRPAGAAGAGYRGVDLGREAAGGIDVEGADGAVSGGVGATAATFSRCSLTTYVLPSVIGKMQRWQKK